MSDADIVIIFDPWRGSAALIARSINVLKHALTPVPWR
jgi:hypothetical protein